MRTSRPERRRTCSMPSSLCWVSAVYCGTAHMVARPEALLLALVHSRVVDPPRTRVGLTRSVDLLLLVVDHLEPLGDPAAGAPDGEQHREHLHRHAQGLIDEARVEVDVRVQLALDEV